MQYYPSLMFSGYLITTAILSLLSCHLIQVSAHTHKAASLLVISFDGFRWNFLEKTDTPNLNRMKREGVHATKGMKSVFPTNTLPNYWTLVTGMFPESHGIIDDHIHDTNITKPFIPKWSEPSYDNDPRYYDAGGEPIWVTNQLQKEHGRSGSIMWFGSEHGVKSIRPTLQMPYNDSVKWEKRIDTVVKWFTSEHPINLGLVYFPEPGLTALRTGPESDDTIHMIRRADEIIGYLLKVLEGKDLLDDINIIVTSDHGFTSTSHDKVINLDNIVDSNSYSLRTASPVASIYPEEGKFDNVYKSLKKATEMANSHFKVYSTKEIPDSYHYKHSSRAPPIIAVADLHYSFITLGNGLDVAGTHGYDNDNQDMCPFFIAMGPSLKEDFAIESFPNVDVYPLMCHLLGIHPTPNNGSLQLVELFLHEGHGNTWWTLGTYVLVLIIIASVAGVFSVAACRQHRYLKRKRLQLRLSPHQSTIKYSIPPRGGDKSRLLSDDEDDDDFDDANEENNENILEIVSKR